MATILARAFELRISQYSSDFRLHILPSPSGQHAKSVMQENQSQDKLPGRNGVRFGKPNQDATTDPTTVTQPEGEVMVKTQREYELS